ncbi:S41 family peptidase [Pontibacter sp. G13]|uniref:S41 family peptidase n=1 Tax=Pontibacter sp. G13 TaxID=3074898 RepID=UPI0028897924|nr:S41 family peptidase [Pontibacter sp. G13]WNJ16479.1 S41 family peptidase [Pontibacter sp. G13]
MWYRKVAIWASVILLSFTLGFVSDISDNYFEISKNLDIFGRLYREINSLYVDDTDPTELMRTGIDAMLESLDPYTNYISEEEVEDFRFMSTGQYGGVGALIGKRDGKIMVIEPYEGYPAFVAGLRAGDQIVKIDNEKVSASSMEISDVRNLLRGNKGTEVTIYFKRNEQGDIQKALISRDRIKIDNVPFFGMVNDQVGYIRLEGFTQDAGKEVQEAVEELKDKHHGIKGIVLDLRGNPGGRLDESVRIANVFIPQKEVIVETRGRVNGSRRTHNAQRSPVDIDIPLAVLVNGKSASASEIVAGAIQDLDRGVIVGQRSFGKGLVQNIRPLSYNTQLKVTTAKYYTPSGRCIQAINYAERDENGSVSRIPDSLQHSFKTRNGRTVYDGGGIAPDVYVEKKSPAKIVQALKAQGLIFDFATQYWKKNKTIPSARDFKVDEQLYAEFTKFVNRQKFDYDTPADDELEELRAVIDREAYASQLQDELLALESELDEQKDMDLAKHQTEIAWLLKIEILKRYYFKIGPIEASLDHDSEILKAAEVLEDNSRYRKLLRK